MTKDLGLVAVDILEHVAAGSERSIELARELAEGVLEAPIVRRALELKELLRTRSPFALVRAVELAEMLATAPESRKARPGR